MKRIAITGANSGIGFAAARELAREGHEILMICRNKERGEKARAKIKSSVNNAKLKLYIADLADLDQVYSTGQQMVNDFDHLDILINNAGVILMNKVVTDIGLEKTLAVNHLGHFLLTDILLPLLLEAEDPRIINTASGAHYAGNFDFEDINYEKSSYKGFVAYSRSKLANILFTRKFNRFDGDISKISIFSIHPGFVGSNFAKNNGLLANVVMTLLSPFNKSITSGAQPLIYLSREEDVVQDSGEYFYDKSWIPFTGPNIVSKITSEVSYDKTVQDKLWDLSVSYLEQWDSDYNLNYTKYAKFN